MIRLAALLLLLLPVPPFASLAIAAPPWPGQAEGDYVLHDYRFASGEVLPELKLHYVTLGRPARDAAGHVTNAVMLLHGTSGTSRNWLQPMFADEMFGPGQPLDLATTYVVIPDGIGRGGSSKPSDGLRTRFPHYRYGDMVDLQHRLLTEHLQVDHLRLLLGGSMGGMQVWMWAGLYPGLMDVAVPLASQPVRISGLNWLSRRIAIDAIRNDPDWNGGNYAAQPTRWTTTAPMGRLTSANIRTLQATAPDVAAGDALYRRMVDDARKQDANDALYATEAVMDYAPEPLLPRITARLVAINSGDDRVNPAELDLTAPAVAKIPGARFVLLPAGPDTRGHLTYEQAAKWKNVLVEALAGN